MTKFGGVIIATVKEVEDPNGEGRIRIEYPWLEGTSQSHWAPVASPSAGRDRGVFVMPEIDDEALVAFNHGDVNQPIVIGFLWNGRDLPPTTSVNERIIRSRNGHTIRLLDSTPTNGNVGGIVIEDGHTNRIVLSNGKITIKATSILELRGATVRINGRLVSPNRNPI